jgi:hypothetical protein
LEIYLWLGHVLAAADILGLPYGIFESIRDYLRSAKNHTPEKSPEDPRRYNVSYWRADELAPQLLFRTHISDRQQAENAFSVFHRARAQMSLFQWTYPDGSTVSLDTHQIKEVKFEIYPNRYGR